MKISILLLLFICSQLVYGQTRYNHILITNDDGIEDVDRLLALANAVSNVADRVSIIVSNSDKSGTSNYSIVGRDQHALEVTCDSYHEEKKIGFYTINANPADCVILGLGGFFSNNRPDLLLSGINGGTNIGPAWFGSGTIGAARTAAFLGVKSIAFSGFDDDNEQSFSIIPKWIAEFISSGFVDELPQNSYVTVGFPLIPFEEIKGVKVIERRIKFDYPEVFRFNNTSSTDPHVTANKTTWELEVTGNPNDIEIKYDDYYLQQGFIVITPMTIEENSGDLMENLMEKTDLIPEINK